MQDFGGLKNFARCLVFSRTVWQWYRGILQHKQIVYAVHGYFRLLYCAFLTQKTNDGDEKPLYYLLHKLSPTQTRWVIVEKECFSIHYALQKLDRYLYMLSLFVQITDKQKHICPRKETGEDSPYIDDRALEVRALHSNRF